MEQSTNNIPTRDLLLVGGGHSHLTVIKQFGMNPMPGLRVTLISKDIHAPYSGMLPGLIAGHYHFDDTHIDLRKLCQWAKVRLFHAEVNDIDLKQQQVVCATRSPVRYDFLSINIGSQPAITTISGAANIGIAVKPIEAFVNYWQQLSNRLQTNTETQQIAVVGGGAASIEVVLACQYHLQQQLGNNAKYIQFSLISAAEKLLSGYNDRTRRFMSKLLAERGIKVETGAEVQSTMRTNGLAQLNFSNGSSNRYNEIIWAIHAGCPSWPQQTGLACNAQGFIQVNQYLQSHSHSNVFAAGDIADFMPRPLAKSGVYAVRAGQTLSDNLRRACQGLPLKPFRPQRQFLSLLTTGDKQAVAAKGRFSIAGHWVWRWKNLIDHRFIHQFQLLPMSRNRRRDPE